MATATLRKAKQFSARSSRTAGRPSVVQFSKPDDSHRRARRLLEQEIEFIDSPEFRRSGASRKILADDAGVNGAHVPSQGGKLPKDLPGHLARLCECKLLSAEEERVLFRRMNYLKYRANTFRVRLDPESPNVDAMNEIERLLAQTARVRDHIIKANMRLVIAIVKKFVTPRHSFDDLLSDGIVSLMQAVDKFDYLRGFRFSTYAYRAIARNAYRTIGDHHKEDGRFDSAASDDLTSLPEQDRSSPLDEHEWQRMRTLLGRMLDRLDRREQFVLRGRFALGAHRKVRTFQCLADKLGVSKERVRQLEQRALAKLQSMAQQVDTEA